MRFDASDAYRKKLVWLCAADIMLLSTCVHMAAHAWTPPGPVLPKCQGSPETW